MLPVKEVVGVRGIQIHGLEPLPSLQRRAGPLPDPAHVGTAGEAAAVLSHRGGMEVLEADVTAFEIGEEVDQVELVLGARGAFMQRFGGGRNFYAFIGEMSIALLVDICTIEGGGINRCTR